MTPPEIFILIPGRTSSQGTTLNEGKFTSNYVEETSTLMMCAEDMTRLSLKDGDRVRLRSEQGFIELPCQGANLGRGYPRFNPGEFTTADTLARREADAALIIASDPMGNFSQPAREHLARIPYIALDPKETQTTRGPAVAFTTATYGINTGGTVYRMDDVRIPLRPAFDSPYPSDEEVLKRIEKRIRELQGFPAITINGHTH